MTTRRRKVRERVRRNKLNRRIAVPALRAIYPAQEVDGTSIWMVSVGEIAFYGEKKGRRISRRRRLWRPRRKPAPFWFALPEEDSWILRMRSWRKAKAASRKQSAKQRRMKKRYYARTRAKWKRYVAAIMSSIPRARNWFTLTGVDHANGKDYGAEVTISHAANGPLLVEKVRITE